MKNFCLILFFTAAAASQVVFPNDNSGSSSTSGNPQNVLLDLLVTSNRNEFVPPTQESDSNACIAATGESGICGFISECPAFILLLKQSADPDTLTFLRNSICRILSTTLHFCCPVVPVTTAVIPEPKSGDCGSPSGGRVIGGAEVKVGSWPWLSAIGRPIDNNGFSSICGGTLITTRHVLSAAHCFIPIIPESERTHVRLGEHHLTSDSDGLIPQDIRIFDRLSNGYDGITKENDIELLFLETEAVINDFVRPACLPIDATLRSSPFEGENATVTGWGRVISETSPTSQVPMQADVPIVPLAPCITLYETRTLGTVLDERMICAGNGLTDACGGDSGGPLNYLDPVTDRYFVIGVVSHGVKCASSEFPGVYTRVGAFVDWIVNNVRAGIGRNGAIGGIQGPP